jgi:hypothetical protein
MLDENNSQDNKVQILKLILVDEQLHMIKRERNFPWEDWDVVRHVVAHRMNQNVIVRFWP